MKRDSHEPGQGAQSAGHLRVTHPVSRSTPHGFTLIEILVAILIFAVMSVMAYRGLSAVLTARERLTEVNARWRELALAFAQMNQSLDAVVPYPVDGIGPEAAPFVGRETAPGPEDAQLAMTTMGDPARPAAQNAARRVGYRLRDGRLEYLVWPAPLAGPPGRPRVLTLLEGVQVFRVRYLDPNGVWQSQWPAAAAVPAGQGAPTVLPWGVEVEIQSRALPPVTRIFALP
ncbi:MAG: type II secretion system minor pseudopilin GspJ [Pseudomonadota bacterium]